MAPPARALLTYAPRRSSAVLTAGRPWAPIPTALSTPRSNTRCLSCTRARRRQHLWWAGSVLDRVSPYLQEVPRDWLAAIGMGADADDGLGFTHLAGGVAHSLLAYRTDPRKRRRAHAAPKEDGEEGGKQREIQEENVILDSGEEAPEMDDGGFAKIVAIGRNTQGQLGLGFTSQESSWGMVSAGFAGRSIAGLQVGNGTSFVVMEQDDGSSKLYAFGNHTVGQLGLANIDATADSVAAESGSRQQTLFSSPTEVELPRPSKDAGPGKIVSIAAGLDHLLVLVQYEVEGASRRYICSCGTNTDGQLGDSSEAACYGRNALRLLEARCFPLAEDDELVGVAAGGDTSFAWSRTGRVWSWGNSEYGQAGHGRAIDRIDEPLEATAALREAGVQGVRRIVVGGPFAAIHDARGKLFTLGFGAIGQGPKQIHNLVPTPVLQAEDVAAGLEYVAASTPEQGVSTWGLDTMAGRLALDPPSRKPWPSYMIASRFTPDSGRSQESSDAGEPAPAGDNNSSSTSSSASQRGMLRHYLPEKVHARRSFAAHEVEAMACSGETLWVLTEDGEEPRGIWDPPDV